MPGPDYVLIVASSPVKQTLTVILSWQHETACLWVWVCKIHMASPLVMYARRGQHNSLQTALFRMAKLTWPLMHEVWVML